MVSFRVEGAAPERSYWARSVVKATKYLSCFPSCLLKNHSQNSLLGISPSTHSDLLTQASTFCFCLGSSHSCKVPDHSFPLILLLLFLPAQELLLCRFHYGKDASACLENFGRGREDVELANFPTTLAIFWLAPDTAGRYESSMVLSAGLAPVNGEPALSTRVPGPRSEVSDSWSHLILPQICRGTH